MTTLNAKVILNVKTAAEWANSTEILLEGELGIESDTRLIKIGNGVDTYPNLPYTAASDINDIEGVTVTNPTDGNVLTYSNGEWVNITPSSLPADTDLSHYDNTTSGFITSADIPSLPADTDLSHYDNTNSDFATVSQIPTNVSELNNDAGYITSSSIPNVGDGTITIQKNSVNVDSFTTNQDTNKTINITVPTNLSELNNDVGYITSATIPTVGDGTVTFTQDGTVVGSFTTNSAQDTTIDLSSTPIPTIGDGILTIQQDGVDVGTFTANSTTNVTIDIPSGEAIYEKEVTVDVPIYYLMTDPNGAWDTTSYVDDSYVNIVPQRSFVDNDTLYINSPAGGVYTSNIASDTPTLSGSIPAWNDAHYIIIHSTTAGYYALYFSYNEYFIRYFPFNGTPTNIDNGFCVGTSSNINYKIYSQDVDSIVKNGYLYIIISGCWRFYSSSSFSCGGFVRSTKVDLSDNSCTPYTITYNNTSYSPSSIPTYTYCLGYSTVYFIGDPESVDASPVACVCMEMRNGGGSNRYTGRWDAAGNFTIGLPPFSGHLESVQVCPPNNANIAFIFVTRSNQNVHLNAYTNDFTQVWSTQLSLNLSIDTITRTIHCIAKILVDDDSFYFVYYDKVEGIPSIILEKRDILTGNILSQSPSFIDRPIPYSFHLDVYNWNLGYNINAPYIRDISINKYNGYLLISTTSVPVTQETTYSNVTYYWTVAKVAMDPLTDTYLVADKDLVSSSSTGSLGNIIYPWATGYINKINTNTVTFSSNQNISTTNATTIAINTNSKSYTFGSGTGGAVAGSDEILKKNVITMPDGALETINELRPVKFDFVSDTVDASYYAGFIAQETDNIVPNLTVPPAQDDKNPVYGIDYAGFVPYLVKAIQELSSKVDELNVKLKKAGL